ncbi:MAG: DNA primase, partial [Hyphomicrobiaceae bacterium]|nr:DNA primase [Hyphomicrobiaceae bacterium]
LYRLLADAQAFFEAQLQTSTGADARRYITMKRGLRPDTIRQFRLGYAPAGRTQLKEYLTAKGFSVPDMVTSGMLIGGDDIPVPYDRFRNRLMFPITDLKDRIIAFGGRALDADAPAKYLNSPETPLFHKGHVLFNAARARGIAHSKGRVIAVEGYMDVVALSEAGFGESVAPLGTALTEDQVKLLWRMSDEPILCFDGDSAGQKAAFRAIDTVLPHLKPGTSVRFAFLPDGLDPDDLIRQSGAEAMEACLTSTKSLVDMLWDREWASGEWTTPERRAQLEVQLQSLISRITDPMIKNHYGQEIRDRLYQAWGRGARANSAQQRQSPKSQGSYYAAAAPASGGGGKRPWTPQGGSGGGGGGAFRPGQRASGGPNGRFGHNPNLGFGQFATMPSESLKNSGIVAAETAAPLSAREALLVLSLLNHPWLIEAYSEDIAAIDFAHKGMAGLRDALLETLVGEETSDAPLDSAGIRAHLHAVGQDRLIALIERTMTHRSDKFAAIDVDRATVDAGWRHILAMHRREVELKRALSAAQSAYDADQSEDNYARIIELNRLMTKRVDLEEA